MQTHEIVQQLMALPLTDRVVVAQELWQSIDEGLASGAGDEQREAIQVAMLRDEELNSGAAAGRTHEEVMGAVRRALGCG